MFEIDDQRVQAGSILCDMHGHEPSGIASAYNAEQPFHITSEMFQSMVAETPARGLLVLNKYAIVISVVEDIDSKVSGILVVYSYDGQYFCNMLFANSYFPKKA